VLRSTQNTQRKASTKWNFLLLNLAVHKESLTFYKFNHLHTGVHKFFRKLRATWKFSAPEMWREISMAPRSYTISRHRKNVVARATWLLGFLHPRYQIISRVSRSGSISWLCFNVVVLCSVRGSTFFRNVGSNSLTCKVITQWPVVSAAPTVKSWKHNFWIFNNRWQLHLLLDVMWCMVR
jgi:hypothetical protein